MLTERIIRLLSALGMIEGRAARRDRSARWKAVKELYLAHYRQREPTWKWLT